MTATTVPRLWRVLLTRPPSGSKRKERVNEYVVLAASEIDAKVKAVEAYRPEAYEVFTVTAEHWDTEVVMRRTFLGS
jgi:hypothetical protein